MKKVLYTITTEIKKPNEEFVEYIEQYVKDFNSIQRKVFHRIKNRNINWKELKNKNALRKEISEDFGLTSKAAYSIVLNMIGRYNSLKETKTYNLNKNENKITKLKKEIKKIEKGKDKKLLYLKKNELNYLNQKNNKLRKDIEDGNFAFCFGSKKLLKTNYEDFVKHRDSSILFTGDRNAQKLNSNFQVNYCKKKNNFNFKARKELYVENGKYIFGEFFLDKKSTKILKDILEFRKSGLTYRIILKNNKYYLQIMYTVKQDKNDIKTSSMNGNIGIKFNKDVITLSETDKKGNLIDTFDFKYKGIEDLREIAKKIKQHSLNKRKDIILETIKKRFEKNEAIPLKYNFELKTFNYKKFKRKLLEECVANNVNIVDVSTNWNTWVAKKKYVLNEKMPIDSATSYVIARKGLKIKEKIK